jgi:hypothetical protein
MGNVNFCKCLKSGKEAEENEFQLARDVIEKDKNKLLTKNSDDKSKLFDSSTFATGGTEPTLDIIKIENVRGKSTNTNLITNEVLNVDKTNEKYIMVYEDKM